MQGEGETYIVNNVDIGPRKDLYRRNFFQDEPVEFCIIETKLHKD